MHIYRLWTLTQKRVRLVMNSSRNSLLMQISHSYDSDDIKERERSGKRSGLNLKTDLSGAER